MSQELIYTSVPKGLKPGSRGFSTVAMTNGLSSSWVDRLESLSAYQPIFPLGDPSADRNPINFCHWRVTIAGKTRSVLSRIAFAGADYSQRSNKFAHHVVLDPGEMAAAGPAWMMRQRGFLKTTWSADPQTLPTGPTTPSGDRQPAICSAWAAATGDAGWAGVLADAFISNPTKPAFLIFEPGMDVLALFEEAIALLPAKRRWDVSFNTYFTELPLNLNCAWRAVSAGTGAEQVASRTAANSVVINLTRSMANSDSKNELVKVARGTVDARARYTEDHASIATVKPVTHAYAGAADDASTPTADRLSKMRLTKPSTVEEFDAIPIPQDRRFNSDPERLAFSQRTAPWAWIAAAVIFMLLSIGLGAIAYINTVGKNGLTREIAKIAAQLAEVTRQHEEDLQIAESNKAEIEKWKQQAQTSFEADRQNTELNIRLRTASSRIDALGAELRQSSSGSRKPSATRDCAKRGSSGVDSIYHND